MALPGRFQRVSSRPDTFFDAGHNPSGTAALCRTLDRHFPGRPLYCVMAMYRDKDYRTCAAAMAERSKVFFAANTDSPRALPAETLAEIARTRCRDVRVLPDAAEALTEARRASGPDGLVLVCGSFAHLSRAFSALPAKKTPSRKGSAQRTDP